MSEKKSKRILVSAGDPSGDLILARVVSEWKKLHPGFSGFTVGVEFSYDSEGKIKLNHGFGFKDFKEGVLTFNAYYINENREIIDHEIYDYLLSSSLKKIDRKMQTHFIEAKRLNTNDFCFCPLILLSLSFSSLNSTFLVTSPFLINNIHVANVV